MKILVISYFFPPYGGGPSVRVHNFVKYLPENGIDPIVLTVDSKYYESLYRDEELIKEYNACVTIIRSGLLFGKYLQKAKTQIYQNDENRNTAIKVKTIVKKIIKKLLIPDEYCTWLINGLISAQKIIHANDLKCIIATGPPFTAHILAAIIAKYYKLPLVLDYRDLWSCNDFYSKVRFTDAINRIIEKMSINTSRLILFTNYSAAEKMISNYNIDKNKIRIIQNGFDLNAIQYIEQYSCGRRNKQKVKINYIGSLTRLRTPEYFLKAVLRIIYDLPESELEIGFIGFVPQEHIDLVKEMKLQNIVTFYGTLPKKLALDKMINDSDILIVFQRKDEGGGTAIPGKVYEYLASGKPILVMDEGQGITTDFMKSIGVIHVTEYSDIKSIYSNMKEIILNYNEVSAYYNGIKKKVECFDRKEQTKELSKLIKEICKPAIYE